MPWNRFRMERPSESTPQRRYSTINLEHLEEVEKQQDRGNLEGNKLDSLISTEISNSMRHSHKMGMPASYVEPSETVKQGPTKPQRFSLLKFRHASDSQLSRTAREQATESVPPMPAAPAIITTAPTMDAPETISKRKSALFLRSHRRTPDAPSSISSKPPRASLIDDAAFASSNPSPRASRITFDEPNRLRSSVAPPAYGDDSNSTLALPVSRLSESSRSDGSLGDHGVYATTTTTHTVSTTTTFFRLPRRKKNKGPLFPLPVKIPPREPSYEQNRTFHPSTSRRPSESPHRQLHSPNPPLTAIHRPYLASDEISTPQSPVPSPLRMTSGPALDGPGFPALRRDSITSTESGRSSPDIIAPPRLSKRGRSSTKESLHGHIDDEPLPTPPLPQSGRTSSSTGRASLGGFFNLSRLRQNSEPQNPRHGSNHTGLPGTPLSTGSKSQSFSLAREPTVVPERQEGDTPAKYLERLGEAVSRGAVAIVLSNSNDEFSKNVLRSYMRGFNFFGDPLDMSIRKLLMEAELPKETQQIDRVLEAFANRYHECNPGIYASPDEAYFIAFSILILHTDVFNKNNKHKMQKQDYTKNARGTGVADEILECFYDNISYTPFIHVEDDVDITGERIVAHGSKKSIFNRTSTDTTRKYSSEPVDPYLLILDGRLDCLRPSLKDVMNLEDPYNYLGTAQSLNLADLHKTFFRTGVLQIVSSRSRPEAFMSPETTNNPAEAHPGVVDIKITKVGILWRKDMKKKKARSPWQEWGAILTGSQLYFFRNTNWIKSLINQCHTHHKQGLAGSPCVFKPPLEQFKPDVLMSTEDAVALLDTTYKKHKHALVFVRHGGFEETFLAENEAEMNDWLAKLNYASAFRSAGVRMRGLIGGHTDSQKTRAIRRMDSDSTTHSVQAPTNDVSAQNGRVDPQLAQQIQEARKQIMIHKIAEADENLDAARKQLDVQLRNARHLQILAPVQNKTREQIVLAAGGMAAKIKWVRMEIWRTKCHKDILELDLDDEAGSGRSLRNDAALRSNGINATPSLHTVSRTGSTTEYTNTPQLSPKSESTVRPSTQPSPARPFAMDDVFQSSVQVPSANAPPRLQGSWELPPLSFEPTRTSLKSGSSTAGMTPVRVSTPAQHSLKHQPSVVSNKGSDKVSELAARLATPTPSVDDDEHEILREAGLVRSETPTPNSKRFDVALQSETGTEKDQDKSKSPDTGFTDGRPKIRRSLQRTLREAHVPSHHRSRKGKDSASSAGMVEDTSSMAESEGLARGAGSFTVHGKKASVITFGSEWQDVSPEARLKIRKQAQPEGSKTSMPSAIEDEALSIRSTGLSSMRPASSTSMSKTTTTSLGQPGDDKTIRPSRITIKIADPNMTAQARRVSC